MSRRSTAAVRRTMQPAIGVPSAADRRFRRPDVRPAGKRGVRLSSRLAVYGILGLIVLGGLALGVRSFLTSSWFVVSHIVVHGTHRLAPGDVETLVSDLRHENVMFADLTRYTQAIKDSPWIADATIRRQLPSTISIDVTEREPLIVARLADRLYLVDRTGMIIDEAGPQYRDFDLPIVDGLGNSGVNGSGVNTWRVSLVERFLTALSAAPALRARVSQIDISDPHDVTVMLVGDTTAVRLGDGAFVDRLQRYLALVPTLRQQLSDLDYVDVRFDNLFVMPRGRITTASTGAGSHAVKRP